MPGPPKKMKTTLSKSGRESLKKPYKIDEQIQDDKTQRFMEEATKLDTRPDTNSIPKSGIT